jgi:lipooligosaccharide transport system permease protein
VSTPLALRSFAYWAYQYRRTWRGVTFSSLLSPVLYLAAMGLALGTLVDRHGLRPQLDGVTYLAFLAPGLLAASVMQTAANESTWPVMGAVKWFRSYHAMLATPLRVVDVLFGHLAWMAVRLLSVSAVFVAVMAAFGAPRSWWVLAAIPAAVLCGMAFAAPIAAFAATRDSPNGFSALFRFGIIPMFLFSGTFFPVSQLPGWIRPVAYLTPLWHGVDLCRSLSLGRVSPGMAAVHVAYLLAFVAVGIACAYRTFQRRLVT